MEKLEPSHIADENVKWCTPFWKIIWQFLKILNTESPRNPEIPLLDAKRLNNRCSNKNLCGNVRRSSIPNRTWRPVSIING